MKNARKSLILLLLTGVLLASCAGQPPAESTPDLSASLTAGVGTIVAYFFETQTALAPTATVTPSITPLPLATNSPMALPTLASGGIASATQILLFPSVTPTGTIFTPTTTPGSAAYGCNNLLFIRDVETPNGTVIEPGERFTRTWKVSNNGTCDWLFGYKLVPVSGANLAQDAVSVNNAPVKPGEWREFSKSVVAPDDAGTYIQYWQLSDGAEQGQIWAIIIITFLMAIPLTTLGVGFNALFAEAVPVEYRAHVAGIRNVTLSIMFMLSSLGSGYILQNVDFPLGYQIVFAIGAIGAAMSSVHLYFIRPLQTDAPPAAPLQPPITLRPYARDLATSLRLDIWNTRFRNVLLALFAFHLTQYLAIPLFPLYNVRVLKLTDDHIGIGTALFYLTVLLGSTQLQNFTHRMGNKKLIALSVCAMALYPLLMAFSTQVWHFYGLSLIGGLTFAMVSGSYANYMLEYIPAHDRPPHLAWYNVVLNIAVLVGSLGGSAVADVVGLSTALLIFAALRFLAGLLILKWG